MSAAEQPTQRYDDGIITTAFYEQASSPVARK